MAVLKRIARNLYTQTIGNSCVWVFRYQINGRARAMGLGSVEIVQPSVAKRKALEFRAMLMDGKDPLEERGRTSRRKLPTFAELAAEYIKDHAPAWRNSKSEQQWTNTLSAYAFPVIGSKPINAIRPDDVLNVLRPIWTTKAETATRVRGRIERVWSRAKALGLCSGDNPASWELLRHSLPSPRQTKRVQHHPAIPIEKIPGFTERLQERKSISGRALLFTLLTAARTIETRLAEWPEVELEAGVWTIPPEKMKAGREHRVPLSPPVVELLREMPRTGALIFPGAKAGKPLSDMALLEAMRDLEPGFTTHGLRSSFRDWAARNGYSAELAEKALAHAVKGKAAAAYQRDDLLEQRRPMMERWAAYCIGQQLQRAQGQPKAGGDIVDAFFAVRRLWQKAEQYIDTEKREAGDE